MAEAVWLVCDAIGCEWVGGCFVGWLVGCQCACVGIIADLPSMIVEASSRDCSSVVQQLSESIQTEHFVSLRGGGCAAAFVECFSVAIHAAQLAEQINRAAIESS